MTLGTTYDSNIKQFHRTKWRETQEKPKTHSDIYEGILKAHKQMVQDE